MLIAACMVCNAGRFESGSYIPPSWNSIWTVTAAEGAGLPFQLDHRLDEKKASSPAEQIVSVPTISTGAA